MQTTKNKKKICQIHKLKIIAVDLKSQTGIDEQYLCARCLTEKVDNKNIKLLNDATEMIQSMRTQSQNVEKEENLLRLNIFKQLQSSIKSFKNYIKTELGKMHNLIDQQIDQIQNVIESKEIKQETQNYDEDIQILTKNYIGNFSCKIPTETTQRDKDLAFVQLIQDALQSLQQSWYFSQIIELIDQIKSNKPIIQQMNFTNIPAVEQHKTPCLNYLCNRHNKEIIMLNLKQKEPEFSRLACVECIEENPIQYVSLKEANKIWNQMMVQQEDLISKHNLQRKIKFNIAIQEIKQLKDQLNAQLQQMLISIDEQLIKNKQDIKDVIKSENKQIFEFDEEQVEKMIELLSQNDSNKHIFEQKVRQDNLDYLFYQKLEQELANIINYDLFQKQQLVKIFEVELDTVDIINNISPKKIQIDYSEFSNSFKQIEVPSFQNNLSAFTQQNTEEIDEILTENLNESTQQDEEMMKIQTLSIISNNFIRSRQQDFQECKICYKNYNLFSDEAIITPCCYVKAHSFCFQQNLNVQAQESFNFSGINCYICQKPLKNYKEYLKRNISPQIYIEVIKREVLKSISLRCYKCQQPIKAGQNNQQLLILCLNCNTKICNLCQQEYHGQLQQNEQCPSILIEIRKALWDAPCMVCPICSLFQTYDNKSNHVSCFACRSCLCGDCSVDRQPILGHGNHYHRVDCPSYQPWIKNGKVILDPEFDRRNCDNCKKSGKPCLYPISLQEYKKLKHY
ncbi:unnamed protein product [Paramecium octaurelia]|uniref:IBR domain-containing protein n=1 Tax=Paramecium octaurelia TaxID=43137 RepID=A0A8S1YQ73_PAROT|nr:unnamed protein product [Paramecium octaurelia]